MLWSKDFQGIYNNEICLMQFASSKCNFGFLRIPRTWTKPEVAKCRSNLCKLPTADYTLYACVKGVSGVLISPLNITRLVVLYYPYVTFCITWHFGFKCRTIEVFRKMTYFNVKCHFVYSMKIHKYEQTLLSKNYTYNVTQCGD